MRNGERDGNGGSLVESGVSLVGNGGILVRIRAVWLEIE